MITKRAPPSSSSIQLYKDTDLICSPIKKKERRRRRKKGISSHSFLRDPSRWTGSLEFLNHSRFPPRCRETWRKLWDLEQMRGTKSKNFVISENLYVAWKERKGERIRSWWVMMESLNIKVEGMVLMKFELDKLTPNMTCC